MITSYKDLIVWQKSVNFSVEVYSITNTFPKSEIFGISSQLRRAAVAIPSNIAEGYARGYKKEYLQFLKIAYASGAECMTQLIIAQKINYLSLADFEKITNHLEEIMKMTYVLMQKLSI